MSWRCEEFVHIGDGLRASGREQIGKRVRVGDCYGTVVDGSDLFITVKWDFWSGIRRRLKHRRPRDGQIL